MKDGSFFCKPKERLFFCIFVAACYYIHNIYFSDCPLTREVANEALENESYRLEEAVDKLLLEVESLEEENEELREMVISNCLTHGY